MNRKHSNTLSSLTAGGTLLLVGLLSSGSSARLPTVLNAAPLAEAIEAETLKAAEEAAGKRPHKRRSRASLSMPYFSFAQSLRPRG
ncbi:hypothetical protein [Pseudoxanthomonas sp. UTMC 1351]|uniref:hypothetical protein n=1 Tax=Pseudoxanthomonas sp. UTMC 1351 TaxID=2695853 RepID=UPI0034CEC166